MEKLFKYLFLCAAVITLSLSFVSCGDDDDKDEPKPVTPDATVVGTWHASSVETEDGTTYTTNEVLVLNADNTGYTTLSVTAESRSSVGMTYKENFAWSEGKTADGIGYISFIHTSGDVIYGTNRYTYTLAGNTLNIAGSTFSR